MNPRVKRRLVALQGVLTDPLCLINAFVELHPLARNGVYALLDQGFSKSSLTIIAGGNPIFTRQLDYSMESLTWSLASAMGLDFDPAENVLQTMPEKFQEKLAPSLEGLAGELRNSIDFYEQEHEMLVAAVYVTGAMSHSRFFISELNDRLGFPKLEAWNPAQSFSNQVPAVKREGLAKEGASLIVALGGAVSTLNPDLPNINLISEGIERKVKRAKHPFRYSVWLASFVAVVYILFAVFTQARARLVATRVVNIRESIAELRSQARPLVDLEQSTWKLNQLDTISKSRFGWSEMLTAVSQVKEPWVDVIDIQGTLESERLANDPGKPGEINTLKQVLTLRIKARDATSGAAAEAYMTGLATHPYFIKNLREPYPVTLVSRMAKQDDPKDLSRSFSVFVVECHFREKVFTR